MCDLTCGYCPNKDMQRVRTFMEDEVFDTILHRYVKEYRFVNAHCPPTFIGHKDGEPLLNKKFPAQLRKLAGLLPDMKIDVYSHGLMLPKLAKRGQDFFQFLGSLPNRARYLMSFHPFNHDGSANDYTETVTYMRQLLQDPPPNVEFVTVSHKSHWVTEEIQRAWESKWAGLPITVHSNCAINPWTGRIEEATAKFNGCPYGDFGHWFFGVTGNVIACCLDLEEEIVFGNVMKDDPAVMFAKVDAFYAEQRAGRWTHQVCADCYGHKRSDLVQLGAL